ncbi:MAG: HAMP domain-containing histidine kinase [Rhizobacter sp.]
MPTTPHALTQRTQDLLARSRKLLIAGRWRAVERCAQQLRTIGQATADLRLETEAMVQLGTAQTRQGHFVPALESLAVALQQTQRQTDITMLCQVLSHIAYTNSMLGHLEEALKQNNQAIFLARRLPPSLDLLPSALAQQALFLAKRARQYRQQGLAKCSHNDLLQAQQAIILATNIGAQNSEPELLLRVQEVHFDLLISQNKLDAARGVLRLIESSPPVANSCFKRRWRIVVALSRARMALESNAAEHAIEQLTSIQTAVQRSRDYELERLFLILTVEAHQRLDRWACAFEALARLRRLDSWRQSHAIDVARQRLNSAIQESRQESMQLVAHDLRHPLSNTMLILESLDRDPQFSAIHPKLKQLKMQIERAMAVSDQFLRHARMEHMGANTFTLVEMGEMLDELSQTWSLSAKAANVTLRADLSFDVMIRGDRVLLTSAVENLLSNALRAAPPGTQVVIQLRRTGPWCLVRVGDGGAGIKQADANEEFTGSIIPNRREAHGWGLHSVRRTAALHGGLFWFEPATPQGTWANLLLPVHVETAGTSHVA